MHAALLASIIKSNPFKDDESFASPGSFWPPFLSCPGLGFQHYGSLPVRREAVYTVCPRQSGAVDVLKVLCSHVLLTWMAGTADKYWVHTMTSCIVLVWPARPSNVVAGRLGDDSDGPIVCCINK